MRNFLLATWRGFGRGLRNGLVAIGALAFFGGVVGFADYLATVPGSGTSFASKVISGTHYAATVLCDATLGEARCATILASGSQQVDTTGTGTLDGEINNPPCPSGTICYVDTPIGSRLDTDINAPATLASQYPATSVPYTASATGTTTATTATLTGASSVTTYICGFSIRANANAAATNNSTVTGTISGTLNFTQWTAVNTSGIGITEMIFTPCVPASGTNQSIAVVSGAPGTGGVVSVTAWGYKL